MRSVWNQGKTCLHLAFYQMKTTLTMLPVQTQTPKAAETFRRETNATNYQLRLKCTAVSYCDIREYGSYLLVMENAFSTFAVQFVITWACGMRFRCWDSRATFLHHLSIVLPRKSSENMVSKHESV